MKKPIEIQISEEFIEGKPQNKFHENFWVNKFRQRSNLS